MYIFEDGCWIEMVGASILNCEFKWEQKEVTMLLTFIKACDATCFWKASISTFILLVWTFWNAKIIYLSIYDFYHRILYTCNNCNVFAITVQYNVKAFNIFYIWYEWDFYSLLETISHIRLHWKNRTLKKAT